MLRLIALPWCVVLVCFVLTCCIWRCLFCFLVKSCTKSAPRKVTPTFVIQIFQKKTSAGGIWENKFGRPAGFGRQFFSVGRRDSEDNFRANNFGRSAGFGRQFSGETNEVWLKLKFRSWRSILSKFRQNRSYPRVLLAISKFAVSCLKC